MGNCQSGDAAPSVSTTREPQPYASAKPMKEDIGRRPSSSQAKAPEGPKAPKAAASKATKSPKRETAPAPKKQQKQSSQDLKGIDERFRDADPTRWKLRQEQFNGSVTYKTMGKQEVVKGQSVERGIENFKANPLKYIAMLYQTNMVTDKWPSSQCQYTLVHRKGTEGYEPNGVNPKGFQTILIHDYQRLPPFKDNVLPKAHRDKYTDTMTHKGRQLHTPTRVPIMPGRGMGVCDTPNLKIIGDVDPSDIHQGAVRTTSIEVVNL